MSGDAVPTDFSRCRCPYTATAHPGAGYWDRAGLPWGSRRARLTWDDARRRPRRAGALCHGRAASAPPRARAAAPLLLGSFLIRLTPCLGGGVRRRAGAQVCSSTRAGRRREQRRSRRWRSQTRRCHCRCHLRATLGSPAPPEPPRSTPLSISGAPKRSSSLRRLTVGCSFRTRPGRPQTRPGKIVARAQSQPLLPAALTPSPLRQPLRGGQRPQPVSPGRGAAGSTGAQSSLWGGMRFPDAFGSEQAPRGELVPTRVAFILTGKQLMRVYTTNLLTRAGRS